MAPGPSSVMAGGQGTVCGIKTLVVMMRPNAHPLLDSAAKRVKIRVVSRKRATNKEEKKGKWEDMGK